MIKNKRHYLKQVLLTHTKADEEMLRKRLIIQICIILGIIIGSLMSITVLGPQIGGLLAAISIHRNDKDPSAQMGISAPVFSNVPTATKESTITLNGISEPGATIKLFVNGPEIATTTADSGGLFTFLNISLIDGNNTIMAKSISKNGTESKNTDPIYIAKDNNKPEIEITSPKDGEIIRNLDKRILIKGKVNKKATVKINDRFAILNNDLTFEVFIGVEEGKVQIKVTATDAAGNTSDKSINVTYEKKSL
jgi:hypothetical protein